MLNADNEIAHMRKNINLAQLIGKKQFRIIPSVYPPINFFENLVEPAEMEILWEIESLTNERLRQEAGDIFLVTPEDRISGPGSSIVMAAFTHTGRSSRFTDGNYGIYYASLTLETAIQETVFHRERFLRATKEEACELSMRVYKGKIIKPLHDLKAPEFEIYHHPENYNASQQFGKFLREKKSWGVIYRSVRHLGGECIAAFRPPAISIPKPGAHLKYLWNSEKITEVINTQSIIKFT